MAGSPRTVFLQGLVMPARIGVYDPEYAAPQRISIDVECDVSDPGGVGADALERVVDYGAIADQVRAIVGSGHVKLVETLAERIAEAVLADDRLLAVRVRVGKLEILPEGGVAGVAISRSR